jgi:hypothetical protein
MAVSTHVLDTIVRVMSAICAWAGALSKLVVRDAGRRMPLGIRGEMP